MIIEYILYLIVGLLLGAAIGIIYCYLRDKFNWFSNRITRNSLWLANSDYENVRSKKIKDLEDTHLVNIIVWVKERLDQYPKKLLPVLLKEARKRKLSEDFINLAPIPRELWGKSEKEITAILKKDPK